MQRGPLIEAFVAYQQGRAFSRATVKRRALTLNSFLDFIEPAGIAEVGPCDIEEWLRRFRAQTCYSYRSDIKMFYRWAVRRGLAPVNPVDDTDPPRLPKRLPRPLQASDLAASLAAGSGDVQLMILLGAFAGLRVSEIAALSTDDVFSDRKPPILVVREGKGRKDRVVPLHETLRSRLAGVGPGYVFPSRTGAGHILAATVTSRISAVFAGLGIEATPHCLRHTFGTELARVTKGNLLAVAKAMGHEDVKTTQGYVGWSPELAELVGEMYAS
jgi:integrase/recombinase XerD